MDKFLFEHLHSDRTGARVDGDIIGAEFDLQDF